MISRTFNETILINGNHFTILKEDLVDSDQKVLEKILQIVRDKLAYKASCSHDRYAKYSEKDFAEKFAYEADAIQCFHRKDKTIQGIYSQIKQLIAVTPTLSKTPQEILHHILSYLTIRDLFRLLATSKEANKHAKQILLQRVKQYDRSLSHYDAAQELFQELFKKIHTLLHKKRIGEEHVVYYPKKGFFSFFERRVIDLENTILKIKALPVDQKIGLNEALFEAARHKRFTDVKLYLICGADPNTKDFTGGSSAINYAREAEETERERVALMTFLLASLSTNTNTWLDIPFKNLELLKLLCEEGARSDNVNVLKKTALHLIVEANEPVSTKKAIIALLLMHGANLEARDAQENTALSLAREPKIVKALCKNGALVDHQAKGLTSLHNAAYHAQFETVKILLEYGANCNLKDPEGRTALYFAASRNPQRLALKQDPENKNKITKQLLQKGADPDRFENDHMPLKAYLANDQFLTPDPEVIELFCKKTKKINSHIDAEGYYLLHHTILKNQIEAVKILLKHHADPNIKKSGTQTTPLHIAVTAKQSDSILCSTEIVEALCKAGANPNHQDEQGNSPLHLAVREGRLKHVEILLKYGADPTLKNALNETPIS